MQDYFEESTNEGEDSAITIQNEVDEFYNKKENDYFEESTNEEEDKYIPIVTKQTRKQMIFEFTKSIVNKYLNAKSKGKIYNIDNHSFNDEFVSEDDDHEKENNPSRPIFMNLIIILLFIPFIFAGFVIYYYIIH
eukprot:Mrub_12766.p1 GENE.Mrub_12766~~Mrub_12766.p1  ORF type:complete len:153 (+),score=30.85 Mrub_12766:55-459(+)